MRYFRSTEFIDDAARDSQATDAMELAKFGFAFGQIRDMEAWYAELTKEGGPLYGKAFSVTGYSLGAHLASAFNTMHGTELLGGQPRIQQVVTFNGVGIGVVDPGTNLTQLISQFKTLSANEDGQAFTFSDAGLSALYQRARQTIKDGGSLSAEDKAMLTSLINPSGDGAVTVDATTKAQALMIWDAIGRIGIIRQEVERLTTIGSGDETGSRPVKVKDSDIGQENLDYQMAVLTVGASTDAASLIGGLVRTYHGKVYTSTIFANQFDVIGASNTAAWRLVA